MIWKRILISVNVADRVVDQIAFNFLGLDVNRHEVNQSFSSKSLTCPLNWLSFPVQFILVFQNQLLDCFFGVPRSSFPSLEQSS